MILQDTVRLDSKGRLTIPKSLRAALGAESGDIFYIRMEDDILLLRKAEDPFEVLALHAIAEYRAGRTKSLDDALRDLGEEPGDE
jgi:AbrB family looped-hinge helix DNA binding protein